MRRNVSYRSLTALTVPKTRKPKFELWLKIIELNNVPLITGTSFIKWDLPHSAAAEHRGRTEKHHIKDHKVSYEYEKRIPVRLTTDKNNMLQENWLHLEVIQEYSAAGKGERIVLGHVKLNLAEYVEASESSNEECIERRYLMTESKINSTVKIGIHMKLLEGEKNYFGPPLKTAPMFGGIAGIITSEQGESVEDTVGHNMPSLSSKSRETGELQDMYRRTLAAWWAAQPGELKADECIEDIFAGGDGWGGKEKVHDDGRHPETRFLGDGSASTSDDDHRFMSGRGSKHRHLSTSNIGMHRRQDSRRSRSRTREEVRRGNAATPRSFGGKSSLEQQANRLKADAQRNGPRKKQAHEVDEIEIREDLRSWRLPDDQG